MPDFQVKMSNNTLWLPPKKLAPCIKIILMELLKRYTINPQVSHGKPIIQGLRYLVESILEYLAGGDNL